MVKWLGVDITYYYFDCDQWQDIVKVGYHSCCEYCHHLKSIFHCTGTKNREVDGHIYMVCCAIGKVCLKEGLTKVK